MKRTERKKLIRMSKTYMLLTIFFLLLLVTCIVLAFTVNWQSPFWVNVFENRLYSILLVIVYGVLLISPIFFNIRGTSIEHKIRWVKNRMYDKRMRMYVEWFFDAIKQNDYIRAIELHNNFIKGEIKSLTRGVLIGYLINNGGKDEKDNAIKHIDNILNELYDPIMK